MTPSDQSRPGALELLADPAAALVLRELLAGPRQPSELERLLPGIPHSRLMHGLGALAAGGAVARKRVVSVPPRAYYELTPAGRALLAVASAVEHWEGRWISPAPSGRPGRWTLHLLADPATRTLLRMLAANPRRPIELDGRLAGLGRTATRRRLAQLLKRGILARRVETGGEVRYALTRQALLLDALVRLAARWERRRDTGAYALTGLAYPGQTPADPAAPPATPATPPEPARPVGADRAPLTAARWR